MPEKRISSSESQHWYFTLQTWCLCSMGTLGFMVSSTAAPSCWQILAMSPAMARDLKVVRMVNTDTCVVYSSNVSSDWSNFTAGCCSFYCNNNRAPCCTGLHNFYFISELLKKIKHDKWEVAITFKIVKTTRKHVENTSVLLLHSSHSASVCGK